MEPIEPGAGFIRVEPVERREPAANRGSASAGGERETPPRPAISINVRPETGRYSPLEGATAAQRLAREAWSSGKRATAERHLKQAEQYYNAAILNGADSPQVRQGLEEVRRALRPRE